VGGSFAEIKKKTKTKKNTKTYNSLLSVEIFKKKKCMCNTRYGITFYSKK